MFAKVPNAQGLQAAAPMFGFAVPGAQHVHVLAAPVE
jgi:hypothetical protein